MKKIGTLCSAAHCHEMAANAKSSPTLFSQTISARNESYNPPQVGESVIYLISYCTFTLINHETYEVH